MALSSSSIFSLPPGRHHDGHGLHLFVGSTRRSWQLRLRVDGRYIFRSIGNPPAMGLAAARAKALQIRAEAASGLIGTKQSANPDIAISAGGISVASTWQRYANAMAEAGDWTSAHHKRTCAQMIKHLGCLEIWQQPAGELVRTQIVEACETISSREVRQRVFRWWRAAHEEALNFGSVQNAVFPAVLPKTLKRPSDDKGTLSGNISQTKRLRELLKASWFSDASLSVRAAHRACALSGHRIGAVLASEVLHLDVENKTWTTPRQNMKVKHGQDFVVQCAQELMATLVQAKERAEATGSKWLFPNVTGSRPILNESVSKHIARMLEPGEAFTAHSWRSALMTWALEAGFDRETAQAVLDHARGTSSDRPYDKSKLQNQTAQLLAAWAKEIT